MTHDELREIYKILDDRYVQQSDCADTQAEVNKRLANDDKRLELLLANLKINNWLTTAIVGGIITLLIKVFLGG